MTRFSREVQLAAQYFYEQGLRENDIDVLAEELGLDGFNDLVDDIIEGQLYERKLTPAETILPARTRRRIAGPSAAPRKRSDPRSEKTAGGKRHAMRWATRFEPELTPRQQRLADLRAAMAARAATRKPESLTPARPSTRRPSGTAQSQAPENARPPSIRPDGGFIRRRKFTSPPFSAPSLPGKTKPPKPAEPVKKPIISPEAQEEIKKITRGTANNLAAGINTLWHGHTQAMAARKSGQGVLGQIGAGLAGAFLKKQVHEWVENLLDEGYDLSAYTWDDMYEIYMEESFNGWVTELIDEGYDLSEYTWDDMRDLYEENLLTERRIRRGSGKKAMPSKKRRSRKIAAGDARRYGSEEAGKRVAAAAMFRSMAEEADINELLRTATRDPDPKKRKKALEKFNELSKIQIGSSHMARHALIPRP